MADIDSDLNDAYMGNEGGDPTDSFIELYFRGQTHQFFVTLSSKLLNGETIQAVDVAFSTRVLLESLVPYRLEPVLVYVNTHQARYLLSILNDLVNRYPRQVCASVGDSGGIQQILNLWTAIHCNTLLQGSQDDLENIILRFLRRIELEQQQKNSSAARAFGGIGGDGGVSFIDTMATNLRTRTCQASRDEMNR